MRYCPFLVGVAACHRGLPAVKGGSKTAPHVKLRILIGRGPCPGFKWARTKGLDPSNPPTIVPAPPKFGCASASASLTDTTKAHHAEQPSVGEAPEHSSPWHHQMNSFICGISKWTTFLSVESAPSSLISLDSSGHSGRFGHEFLGKLFSTSSS